MKQVFSADAPSGLPDGFYIGMMCSPILKTKVTVTVVFYNNTNTDVDVAWANSHLYKVTVTDNEGTVFDLEKLLPAPHPDQPPTPVPATQQHRMVFPVDTSLAPYAGVFSFDPAKGPYTFRLVLNSPSHPYTLSETVPVLS
ncbi:hypothetical protein AB4Y44_27905 [Paraburkholderia sp. BR10937]|uniref:hypothetical protein n=1 Tax=Paraburkholderia sp. BR10937 TaxID=3236994 RepID=UPI0034D33FC2